MVCLDDAGRSGYYYLHYGHPITLVETLAKTWEESADGLTGEWTISALQHGKLEGTWNKRGYTGKFDESPQHLPISLIRIADVSAPCQHAAYLQSLVPPPAPAIDKSPAIAKQDHAPLAPNGHTISSAGGHAYYVAADGGLWAWGTNESELHDSGENPNASWLGDGTDLARRAPVQIGRDFVTVSAGVRHALGLKRDGSLWVWGQNADGQLGKRNDAAAAPVSMGTGYIQAVAGGYNSYAIKEDGSLLSWGNNDGSFGNTAASNSAAPHHIEGKYFSVSAGDVTTAAIKRDGTLWAWGFDAAHNGKQRTLIAPNVRQAEVTDIGIIALRIDGSAFLASHWNAAPTIRELGCCYKRVMASNRHIYALKDDNTAWNWPTFNVDSVLVGKQFRDAAKQVGEGIADIVAADYSTYIALRTNGSIWTRSEEPGSPLLGDGVDRTWRTPTLIGTGYTQISAGLSQSAAIKSDGSLWVWGQWEGNSSQARSFIPKQLPGHFKQIACGNYHIVALDEDGSVWTNYSVLIGKNAPFQKLLPADINHDFIKVAAGDQQSMAIKSDGTLWSWGDRSAEESRDTPVKVGEAYVDVAVSGHQTLALRSDGSLWAWGFNGSGELGDGSRTARAQPIRVPGDHYIQLVAGEDYSLALKKDGTLWAMGNVDANYLADPTHGHAPDLLGPNFTRIATSAGTNDHHWMAIREDGTLWAWGDNMYGELGDNTQISREQPVRVGNGYQDVAAGDGFTLALKPDGSLWTWGSAPGGRVLGAGESTFHQIAAGVSTGLDFPPLSNAGAPAN